MVLSLSMQSRQTQNYKEYMHQNSKNTCIKIQRIHASKLQRVHASKFKEYMHQTNKKEENAAKKFDLEEKLNRIAKQTKRFVPHLTNRCTAG